MRSALLLALQDYAGAVLIVSHDRSLLRGACDRFLVVAGGAVRPFDGDLEDYAAWLAQGAAPPVAESGAAAGTGPGGDSAKSRRDARRREAAARNRLSPLRAELRAIEVEIEALAKERAEIERALADPAKCGLAAEFGRIAQRTAALEDRWLALGEEIDAAQRA